MTDTTDKLIIQAETHGVQQSTDQLNQLGKSMDGVTVASDKVEKSTISATNQFAGLERRLGTAAGQAAQFAKVQETVNKFVAQNPQEQERANAVLAAATSKYASAGAEIEHFSGQSQAFLHSVRSGIEGLASGQPLLQVATQQFGHLSYAMTGEGGLAGAFKQVGSLVGGMITPLTLTIAGTVGLAAAAAALTLQYDKLSVSSQRALLGAGARTGTSIADLNNFTSQNSSAFGLSNKEARGLGEDLTATGEIVISKLHGMSDAVVGFANQTGKSISDARKEFVAFGTDPLKSMEALSKVYGDFDAKTMQSVLSLTLAGDKTGAFQAVIDALAEKSKKAAENMGLLEKAGTAVANFLSKPAFGGPTDPVEAARTRLNSAIEKANQLPPGMSGNGGAISDEVEKASRAFEELYAAQQKVMAANDGISTQTTLQLNALQNQLPIIQATTEGKKQEAQYYATINQLIADGKSKTDAIALAQQQYTNAVEAARTAVEQEIIALGKQNDIIQAGIGLQGTAKTEAEAAVAVQQKYKDVLEKTHDEQLALNAAKQLELSYELKIDDQLSQRHGRTLAEQEAAEKAARAARNGADATKQWANNTLVLADAADSAASSFSDAAAAAAEAASQLFGGDAQAAAFGGFGGSKETPTSGGQYTSTSNVGYGFSMQLPYIQSAAKQTAQSVANSYLANGGLNAAISAAQGLNDNTNSNIAGPGAAQYGIKVFGNTSESDILSNVTSLYDLKNAQTDDNSVKVKNLNEELAWLQSRPETIARDQAIANLMQSIKQLTSATDSNTAATEASLNPLYNGRGALHVGYYKAAKGLDVIAQGPPAGDQIPFHAMVNGGERITIQPAQQQQDGGGRTIINNITLPSAPTSNARRSQRQWAQGFGAMAAALSS